MTPTLQTPAELERRQTVRDQLRMIRRAHGRHVAWDSRDPADYRLLYDDRHVLVSADDVDRVQGAFADPGNQEQFFEGEGTVLNADDDVRGATISEIVRIVPPVSRRRRGPDVLEATRVVNRFLDEPGVVSPDHILHVTAGGDGRSCPATEPEETGLKDPWPGETKATEAGKGVRIAVIDTGWLQVVANYPTKWLARGVSGEPEPERPALREYAGHGTFIAGVLRCRAPKADIDHLRYGDGGAVSESVLVGRLAEVLKGKKPPHIINLSAGCHTWRNLDLKSFEQLRRARRRLKDSPDTVLVAAAGNDGSPIPFFPAASDWAFGVGSLDRDGSVSSFSNYGESADVFVLGRNHVNAFPKGKYVCKEAPNKGDERFFGRGLARWSGTSFATPLFAGILAARFDPAGGRTVRDVALELVQNADVENDPLLYGDYSVIREFT